MSSPPRLFLITPPVETAEAALALIEPALAAGDVACLLLRLAPAAPRDARALAKAIVPALQARDVAVLLEDARMAAPVGADGAHVTGAEEDLAAAIEALKPDRIVGVGGLLGRDEAMRAGESGADYVMFDGLEAPAAPLDERLERLAWWAELFNVPCVGLARSLDEAEAMAGTGAEFVALDPALWAGTDPAACVAEAQRRIERAAATAAGAP